MSNLGNLPPNILSKLSRDSNVIIESSKDFGKIVLEKFPDGVYFPTSVNDIIDLVKFSYDLSVPFHIAARGHGHSIRGQAMAQNGLIVEMNSLNNNNENCGIRVYSDSNLGFYADVGGEQLWIDVLNATIERDLAPVSWTDYLYLTVGGTLSNAGISGQTFQYGPQISNVLEMDVITGKGELVTCSKDMNSELFFAVLGGLGQFGIIIRARIVLQKAPKRVKWVRMLYDDFSKFTKDQEHLISIDGLDYVEGSLMLEQSSINNWRSSFFSPSNQTKIESLLSQNEIMYCLEMVKYYDDHISNTIDEELKKLVKGLKYLPGFIFNKDTTFVEFLDRVRSGELELQSKGLWDVPHPWLNLFVPKSNIMDFNVAVFKDIILKQKKPTGSILVYPTCRKRQEGVRATTTQVHHMISERRRREKLNENFQHLRSLLPLGTKKDKASVLASTTDYISCLKDQVKELCKRNEILEAQLLNKKEAFQFQQNESGKVAVYITNVEERIVDLQVIARGKCSIVDLVICLMKFLKMVNFVNLVAIDANTTLVQSCPVAVITLRLTIQGDEWEESTFIEATKRVVEYTT
ncbi:Cytokinin dehydrogenase 5 [Capsicum annuum]|uniref:cytokinin dehydrogenase n=1 Tax=Capsicum annuum TaxID=4072 RepID=A0A2G2YUZ6_CAPAN|nr:Cytokinin dehydrogenase 5 [Capsicum annuum]